MCRVGLASERCHRGSSACATVQAKLTQATAVCGVPSRLRRRLRLLEVRSNWPHGHLPTASLQGGRRPGPGKSKCKPQRRSPHVVDEVVEAKCDVAARQESWNVHKPRKSVLPPWTKYSNSLHLSVEAGIEAATTLPSHEHIPIGCASKLIPGEFDSR